MRCFSPFLFQGLFPNAKPHLSSQTSFHHFSYFTLDFSHSLLALDKPNALAVSRIAQFTSSPLCRTSSPSVNIPPLETCCWTRSFLPSLGSFMRLNLTPAKLRCSHLSQGLFPCWISLPWCNGLSLLSKLTGFSSFLQFPDHLSSQPASWPLELSLLKFSQLFLLFDWLLTFPPHRAFLFVLVE